MHHDAKVEAFYTSRAWRRCRAAVLADRGGLCELCLRRGLIVPAVHVHHKTPLTADTVIDPSIALDESNLMALCEDCHQAQHRTKRWRCDAMGRVTL